MLPQRSALVIVNVILALLLRKYVVVGTSATADDGVDYEASDMKRSTLNDPQLNQMYVLHGMVESSQDAINSNDQSSAYVDAAPSEIIETHVLPEEEQPEPIDETNVQAKRPRRRRRRRRRKRPKPVLPNPEELESYYTLPEEEIKRKPTKYRPEVPEELSTDGSNVPPPRRRNVKRRRRPNKRPPIDATADYMTTDEGGMFEVSNRTDVQVDQNLEGIDEAPVSQSDNEPVPNPESISDAVHATPSKSTKEIADHPKVIIAPIKDVDIKPRTKYTDQAKIFTSTDARRYENEAASELTGSALRRHKRPTSKVENTADVEITTKPEPSSTATPRTSKPHPTYGVRKNEVKIDDDNQQKHKYYDRSKQNETKKENFKLRPLPPISAILRNAKLRMKNETHAKAAKAIEIPPTRLKETVGNEILSHVASNDEHNETHDDDFKVEENQHKNVVVESSTTRSRDNFQFPVIAYTEQKQKSTTTTSTVKSFSESPTTDDTAYIYIPCNHTTTAIQPVNDITTASTSESNLETVANISTISTFETTAIHELEKLLKSEIDSFGTRNTSEHTAQSQDASVLESQLDYLIKHKSDSREPKQIPDPSPKLKHDSKDDRIPKISTIRIVNEDIFLTYTSTAALPPAGFYNELDPRDYELSLHLRNASTHYRKIMPDGILHKTKNQAERKKLPLAVKSAIIISGAILALAVLGFFALLLSCKIRQAKSRMKCHRELYREQFQNSEFRQSSRSTSPVVSKTNYNGRTFSNNIQSNVASNRNYYLWQTLRKTFQYD